MSVPEWRCSQEPEASDYPGARVVDNYEQPHTVLETTLTKLSLKPQKLLISKIACGKV